jgi:hypothetical protein
MNNQAKIKDCSKTKTHMMIIPIILFLATLAFSIYERLYTMVRSTFERERQ